MKQWEKVPSMFLDDYEMRISQSVAESDADHIIGDDKGLIGYVYESDGSYKKYLLDDGIENVAKFICYQHKSKMILNSNDHAIISTIGKQLDMIVDMEYRKLLIPYIDKFCSKNEIFSYH